MKDRLSPTEERVAEEYCRGLNDQEVADRLGLMVWTIRTFKKRIFRKLNVNNTHEMVLLIVGRIVEPTCNITEIRQRGIQIFVSLAQVLTTIKTSNEQ